MNIVGRVITGYSQPHVAIYSDAEGTVKYSEFKKLAEGVKISIEPNSSGSNNFYADNAPIESSGGVFTGGTATLEVNGLKPEAEKMIMGLPDAVENWTDYGETQNVPYVGIGFIVEYQSKGKKSYQAYVLKKAKFDILKLEAETRGEEVDYQTQELEAVLLRDAEGNWKSISIEFETEGEALNALKNKMGNA